MVLGFHYNQHATRVLAVMSGMGIIAFIEYFFVNRRKLKSFSSSDSTLANFWMLYINASVNFVLTGFIIFNILFLCYQHGFHLVDNLNIVLYWGLLFVIQDFSYYWQHRYQHECRWGWAVHVLHHSSNQLNTTVSFRESPLSTFALIWIFWMPACFLGFSAQHVIIMEAIIIVYQIWIHNELIGTLGFFELIFNTASHHRVHHAKNPQYINKNYGAVLILWDKLFGTFAIEEEKPEYGITTSISSNNPLYLIFHGWYEMVHDVIKQKSWKPFIFINYKKIA
jgi:sterol desaturase/sphingolipid hydroxylase (fatty acid hydroxylase superfamily)